VKQAIFVYVNHTGIRSWNQPVLTNERVSCSLKQQKPSILLDLMSDQLLIRCSTHCATLFEGMLVLKFKYSIHMVVAYS